MTPGNAEKCVGDVTTDGTEPGGPPYYADDLVTLHHGDCLDILHTLPDHSVDAVVTDPPYGLEFMGKTWDAPWQTGVGVGGHNAGFSPGAPAVPGVRGAVKSLPSHIGSTNPTCRNCGGTRLGNDRASRRACRCERPAFPNTTLPRMLAYQQWCEEWVRECLRVLKPGGHLLAFGGTRTAHRLACAIEDAGFELRDTIAWLYGSGFPKSRNLDGDWQGWGTALKPANEPIIVARKPLTGTVGANVHKHGTGALNIDGCRTEGSVPGGGNGEGRSGGIMGKTVADARPIALGHDRGRWPTNVVLDPDVGTELDAQTGTLTSGANPTRRGSDKFRDAYGDFKGQESCDPARGADSGGASRFFPVFRYEAKAPTDERPRVGETAHPTVKPLDLMRWLVRLVTPPGGLVLEPFAGSGTTAEACIVEGFRCIAIEREADYLPLILARITKPIQPDMFGASA